MSETYSATKNELTNISPKHQILNQFIERRLTTPVKYSIILEATITSSMIHIIIVMLNEYDVLAVLSAESRWNGA